FPYTTLFRSLADRNERERHRREQEVVDVEVRQERIPVARRRERADAEDQRGQQHEGDPAAEPHGPVSTFGARPPTIASTIRRSPSSSPWISSTILPRDITSTRSHSPASSSGSLDLTISATPSSAFARHASASTTRAQTRTC